MTKAPREPGSRLPGSRLRRYDVSSQGARAAKKLADTTTARRRNVSSQGAEEPAPTEPAATTVRRHDVSSQEAEEPAPMEPVKTTVRRQFYHVLSNYTTIALADVSCQGAGEPAPTKPVSDLCLLAHIYCCYSTDCQLRAQQLLYGQAGPHAVNQSAVTKRRAARRPRYRASYRTTGPHAICSIVTLSL